MVDLRAELSKAVEPGRVLTRAIDRLAYANDASVYRLVPRAVVRPRTIGEIRGLFRFSHAQRIGTGGARTGLQPTMNAPGAAGLQRGGGAP